MYGNDGFRHLLPRSWRTQLVTVSGAALLGLLVATRWSNVAMTFILLLCVVECAQYWPRGLRFLSVLVCCIVPFAAVTAVLRPDELNYYAYAGVMLAVSGISLAVVKRSSRSPVEMFLVYSGISGIVTYFAASNGGSYMVAILGAGALGAYLVGYTSAVDERDRLLNLFLFAMVIQSILAISQVLFGGPNFEAFGVPVHESDRNILGYVTSAVSSSARQGTGTFDHFNRLGALLSIAVPISYARLRQGPRHGIARLTLPILVLALVLTFSRSGFVGALVGVGVCWTADVVHRRASWKIVVAGLLVGVAAIYSYGVLHSYMQASGNAAARFAVWGYALEHAFSAPHKLIFGFGLGYFQTVGLANSGVVPYLHSWIVQVLAELGLVGSLLFVLAVTRMIRSFRSCPVGPEVWGLAAAAVAFLVGQSVENMLFAYEGLFFFLVVGLLWSSVRCSSTKREQCGTQLVPCRTPVTR